MIGRCKKCGNEELSAYDTVIALAAITGWRRNAQGGMEPEYEGSSEVIWDAQAPYNTAKPYHCGDCDELLALEDIDFAGDDEDSESGAPEDTREPDYDAPDYDGRYGPRPAHH